MSAHPAYSEDLDLLEQRLANAVLAGLIEPGLANRVRLGIYLHKGIYPWKYDSETTASAGTVSRDGAALSGETLGGMLGLSRAAVNKHVSQLRDRGFAIESVAGSGYTLTAPADDLLAGEAVLPYLLHMFEPTLPWQIGLPYLYRESCESTNLVLRAAMGESPSFPSGAVAVTDHQASGRGRLGRGWSDQPGKEIMFSVLFRPSLAPGQAHLLSLAAALAVAQTLEALPGLVGRVRIKWPNDVLIDGGKVCGILLEGSMDTDRLHWAVAGIGVNVNSDPEGLEKAIAERGDEGARDRPRPASVRERLGRPVPRAPLVAALFKALTGRWSDLEAGQPGVDRLLAGLRGLDALAGSTVEVRGGPGHPEVIVAGEAVGIGAEGQLLVRVPSGETIPVVAGDVTVNRYSGVG